MADPPSCLTIILSEWVPFLNKHQYGFAPFDGAKKVESFTPTETIEVEDEP